MSREIEHGADVRNRIKAGIDKAADTLKVTLGVNGRNVVLDTNPYAAPLNTNDGVTIARELISKDPFENIGMKMVKEVAGRTNDAAGDGTTTASVLLQAIVNEGIKAVNSGADAIQVRRGIERAAQAVVALIGKEAIKADTIETLTATATISCGDPELGKLVAEIIKEAGEEGIVTLEDNPETETITSRVEGLKLRGGITVSNFINSPELQQAVMNDAAVFVTNQNISSAQDMGKIMEATFALNKKHVVVIANGIEADALITAAKNWIEGKFWALPIRVIAYGDMGEGMLRDVAAITGATFFDGAASQYVSTVTAADLGSAEKVVASKHDTTLIGGSDETKADRVKQLQAEIKSTDREYEKESLRERIAKLNNALFTIKVGGQTDTERQERKLRIEDAINATKAALTDGIIAGGGSALYRAAQKHRFDEELKLDDEGLGIIAVLKACEAPLRQMYLNGGLDIDRSDLDKLAKSKKLALDFKTGTIVNALEAGIVDPVKVVSSALLNAASAAALFLVTEAAVVINDTPQEEQL